MRSPYKGGRGKKAPWKSKCVSIPEPLWEQVDQLLTDFYSPPVRKETSAPPSDLYNRTKAVAKGLNTLLTRHFTGAQKPTKEEI